MSVPPARNYRTSACGGLRIGPAGLEAGGQMLLPQTLSVALLKPRSCGAILQRKMGS